MGGSESPQKAWPFLVASTATATALLAASTSHFPPWRLGLVWLVAWAFFAYGVYLMCRPLLIRVAVPLIAGWVVYGFWQAQTPKAELKFVETVWLKNDPSVPPGILTFNLSFKNVGGADASYRMSKIGELTKRSQLPKNNILQEAYAQNLIKRSWQAYSGVGKLKADGLDLFSIDIPASPEQQLSFTSVNSVVLVAGEIHYSDWWLFERDPLQYCFIFWSNTGAVNECVQ